MKNGHVCFFPNRIMSLALNDCASGTRAAGNPPIRARMVRALHSLPA
jgi:hypothetical protein